MDSRENILLIRLKSIGDILFTLPAVHVVRENFPDAKLHFLVSQEHAPLLRGFSDIDEIIPFDRAVFRSKNFLAIERGHFPVVAAVARARIFRSQLIFRATARRNFSRGGAAHQNAGATFIRAARLDLHADFIARQQNPSGGMESVAAAKMRSANRRDPQRICFARRCARGGAEFFRGEQIKRRETNIVHPAVHERSAKKLAAGKLSEAGVAFSFARSANHFWRRAGRPRRAGTGARGGICRRRRNVRCSFPPG